MRKSDLVFPLMTHHLTPLVQAIYSSSLDYVIDADHLDPESEEFMPVRRCQRCRVRTRANAFRSMVLILPHRP